MFEVARRVIQGESSGKHFIEESRALIPRVLELASLTAQADTARGVRRSDVRPGDVVIVKTRNSTYSVQFGDCGTFVVSGGWFDRVFGQPFRTTIAGCTWGGTMLLRDYVAACGMHLEFGNRVVTSAIEKVVHFRGESLN